MFRVEYRCLYREHWYNDLETDSWDEAVKRTYQLSQSRNGSPARVVLTIAAGGFPAECSMFFADRGATRTASIVGGSADSPTIIWR